MFLFFSDDLKLLCKLNLSFKLHFIDSPRFNVFQQLLRSQNPALTNNANGQHLPHQTMPAMAAQQQFLAQQNAYAAQQAAPYMMQGQEPFMATMLAPQAYYGVPPWVYPAGLIPQQGTQPRRPLTPSQGAENQPFVSIFHFNFLHFLYSLSFI